MKLNLIKLPETYNEDTDNGRFYVTPEGNRYRSVTTFLGLFSDNKWVQDWIDRVGEAEAARVSGVSARRGTAVHAILEQFVLGNKEYHKKQMPVNLMVAESMIKHLRAHCTEVRGIEIGLWSDLMCIAGRADLLGVWDGKLSIIDFKTAKRLKNEEDIQNYFLQCTLYALMVEELTGLKVPQIVVLIGVDNEEAQVFVKRKIEYIPRLVELVKEYKNLFTIK